MPDLLPIYSLVYRSQASRAVHDVTLKALLRKARQHNQSTRLSGLLIFANGEFLQVLEGPEPALTNLYERIEADSRHFAVQKLAYGPVAERAFPDWRMAYAPADKEFIERATGFLTLTATPGLTAHPSDELNQLLRDFVDGVAQDL